MNIEEANKKVAFYIGLSIICFLMWTRFIRIRIPRGLEDFGNVLFLIIFVGVLLALLLVLIQLFNLKLKSDSKLLNNSFVTYFRILFLNYVVNGPKVVGDALVNQRYVNIGVFMKLPLWELIKFSYTVKIKRRYYIYRGIYIITNTLPKSITCTIFLLDIFYYQKLALFYYSLILLGIPLISNALFYLYEKLADLNCPYLLAHLKRVPEDDEPNQEAFGFADEIPPIEGAIDIIKHRDDGPLLAWFVENLDSYLSIGGLMLEIKEAETIIKPYENLYIYGCYVIGWGYLLYCSADTLYLNLYSFFTMLIPVFECPFSS